MNDLFSIKLYRKNKMWVFDDIDRQLKAEPFVLGASEVISKHLNKLGVKKRKPIILFSETPIPGAQMELTLVELCYPNKQNGWTNVLKKEKNVQIANWIEDKTKSPISAWYIDQDGDKLWLCPAQLKFFGEVAYSIYAKFA